MATTEYLYITKEIVCTGCGKTCTHNFTKETDTPICSDCNGTMCWNCCRNKRRD